MDVLSLLRRRLNGSRDKSRKTKTRATRCEQRCFNIRAKCNSKRQLHPPPLELEHRLDPVHKNGVFGTFSSERRNKPTHSGRGVGVLERGPICRFWGYRSPCAPWPWTLTRMILRRLGTATNWGRGFYELGYLITWQIARWTCCCFELAMTQSS